MIESNRNAKIKTAQINQALGVFIFIFGIIITIAMVFTETFIQQMTDLAAGMVLMSIGGGMLWKSNRTLKKYKPEEAN
ncbi:MAG TPA: hypothetical protein VFD35_09355 [Pricia sp.]|nr:hypothetical protein [Pricia sp.]